MTPDLALALSNEMLWTAIMVSAPVLGLSMLVGLIISILQVVTQIQEMSLTFIPKIFTVAVTLIIFGPWMLRSVMSFATSAISNIPQYF
ncbi:MAG: flagellar biosynthesis protein FliQ [Candidatus Thiodiazotropha sp. (ex Dulcina madagascariensis)]|nr:flagellar biosynthesis protein FliQ [Candidatus Thiodiazotropha sp. (ex Epidulcina cf. delphinae)]MCU7922547.1 flagellar biosynthesis protein FliQ [Candidatus Thiodiazotropha sp. (ex Dulcina madagascariensis)]MCU7925826.1 flagellar biosynthesis protein FliQ [Candidatus Thiodiazotropha sp. (ex Dulcina madagascariensis)]MCU7934005.1 flagellar biosynthesis protein FliQ [Candidatus Thiodiazotropha sp. (ex Dulcina madagascariensis)]